MCAVDENRIFQSALNANYRELPQIMIRVYSFRDMDYQYGSHTVYKVQYHFVFVKKYRYQVLVVVIFEVIG